MKHYKHYLSLFLVLTLIIAILFKLNFTETFDNPEKSTESQVGEGSSEYYGWGFSGIKDEHKKKPTQRRHKETCPKCDHVYLTEDVCNIVIEDDSCKRCDITKNKDIDKYVLKSSVPPCPDMSQYAKKSMLQPSPDMNKYMLKSELPKYCSSQWADKDKYMLKSMCKPTHPQHEIVYKDITKHPEYPKYISKEHCKKYKKSWIQNLDEWTESIFGGARKNNSSGRQPNRKSGYPAGYSYSPYAGYGTDNVGYALDGGEVKERHLYTPEGL